uniref:Capsid protein n=1 Tax=viral metagenome TaxID=1070528 RepID=A0A6H1ZGK6_9ZZZZ
MGTAWSNIVSDGATSNMNLDYPALKALRRIGGLVKTPKGKPFVQDYTRIIVNKGSVAEMRALEMQGAIKNNKIPGEFSNDGSAAKMFELVANPYFLGTGDATSTTNLSSATAWAAIDTKTLGETYGPQYFESEPISLNEQHVVYKTKEIQHSVTALFAYGHNDARATAHSTGANA